MLMRWMILHRTNAHWETGALPDAALCERVRAMIGEIAEARLLLAAEGLRPTSQGVRLQFKGAERTVVPGPFKESKGSIAAFWVLRVRTLEDAIAWSTRVAQVIGDVEVDVRPVTEPWDIGMVPKPERLETQRYMATHKVPNSDGALHLSLAQKVLIGRLMEEMREAGVLLSNEDLQPAAKGAHLQSGHGKPVFIDGPFTEAKEVLGGFIIIKASSLDRVRPWAERYVAEVGAEEVEIRLLADPE
jgi:hypothetical protein